MARIKHIAIATEDLEGTTKFYMEGLGLTKAGEVDNPVAKGVYLTDGYINLAVLQFLDDFVATTEGSPKYRGVHHFGLEVEDLEASRKQIEAAGAVHKSHPGADPAPEAKEVRRGANVEVKFFGPDGVMIDLSQSGWVGTGD